MYFGIFEQEDDTMYYVLPNLLSVTLVSLNLGTISHSTLEFCKSSIDPLFFLC